MISSAFVCLFVCLLAVLRKNHSTDVHKGGKVAHGPGKKLLGFGGRAARVAMTWMAEEPAVDHR